jgi:hypothetical protein
VKWKTVCLPKDQGGLGVIDLEVMNIALLSKWLWKIFNEKGQWQTTLQTQIFEEFHFGPMCSEEWRFPLLARAHGSETSVLILL